MRPNVVRQNVVRQNVVSVLLDETLLDKTSLDEPTLDERTWSQKWWTIFPRVQKQQILHKKDGRVIDIFCQKFAHFPPPFFAVVHYRRLD
jgi:hypothetical protein